MKEEIAEYINWYNKERKHSRWGKYLQLSSNQTFGLLKLDKVSKISGEDQPSI